MTLLDKEEITPSSGQMEPCNRAQFLMNRVSYTPIKTNFSLNSVSYILDPQSFLSCSSEQWTNCTTVSDSFVYLIMNTAQLFWPGESANCSVLFLEWRVKIVKKSPASASVTITSSNLEIICPENQSLDSLWGPFPPQRGSDKDTAKPVNSSIDTGYWPVRNPKTQAGHLSLGLIFPFPLFNTH